MKNIVIVEFLKDVYKRHYTFKVPQFVVLKRDTFVLVRNTDGSEGLAKCVTNSHVVDDEIARATSGGREITGNVVGTLNHLFVETKSKRLQLLLQPSLLERLRARAKAEGESVNNLVHSILDEALTDTD